MHNILNILDQLDWFYILDIFQIINIHYDVVIVLNLSKMHWYILRSKSIVAIIYTLYEFIIRFTFPLNVSFLSFLLVQKNGIVWIFNVQLVVEWLDMKLLWQWVQNKQCFYLFFRVRDLCVSWSVVQWSLRQSWYI